MVSEHDKKYLSEEQIGRLNAIDASVRRGVMSMEDGHEQAEAIRGTAGYSGGADGSEYIKTGTKNTDAGGFDISSLLSKENSWKKNLEDAAKNYTGMSYGDFLQSDDYASLAKRYGTQGQKAMQNTLGEVAARTGGLASSYAVSAAQQQYNDFLSRLEDAALSMYDAKRGEAAENLGVLQSMYEGEENRNKYLTDWAYQLGRDKITDARYADETKYMKEQDTLDRLAKNDAQNYEKMLLRAETLAASGNFDGYRALGYTDADIASLQKKYDDDLAYEKALRDAKLAGDGDEEDDDGEATYKPTISLEDAFELYNSGTKTSGVINALRYYLGDDYFGEDVYFDEKSRLVDPVGNDEKVDIDYDTAIAWLRNEGASAEVYGLLMTPQEYYGRNRGTTIPYGDYVMDFLAKNKK